MPSDFEIGRVVAVDTAEVTVQLNEDLRALTRTTSEGAQEIGRINGYIILPVGARRLVAMVTRVVLSEEAEMRADRTMVTLPAARRVMKATLIGTIDGRAFTQGVSVFPVLDNPVLLAAAADLAFIFDRPANEDAGPARIDRPGYCVRIGDSAVFDGYPIRIDPDTFFGKHAAILGSTGSGKSCTVATLIQSIHEHTQVRRTRFIILDTNGEYRRAFQSETSPGDWEDLGSRKTLYIPSDPREAAARLVLPYWFLNADDFVRLFRAREGLQAPVLLRALRLARARTSNEADVATTVGSLRSACSRTLAIAENDVAAQIYFVPANLREACADNRRYRQVHASRAANLEAACGESFFDAWESAFATIDGIATGVTGGAAMGATRIQQIRDAIEPIVARLNAIAAGELGGVGAESAASADHPSYFARAEFLEGTLDMAMREEAAATNPGRVRDACGPMTLRIRRFFEDPRFDFLFRQHPSVAHALATFLRDALGLPSAESPEPPLEVIEAGKLPFYDRQRAGSGGHDVVILDLSLLAAEVLENVTALIGRLVLEFLQRMGEFGDGNSRGSLPVVLVLEEAQNYISERRGTEDESISRTVFERIAREGRKHGLGLVVSSQRPSELSKTVLSQCSSFVVHRLQNPEDIRYFKEIVPGIYGALLNQLPALAPQTALVLGEGVRAPALVRIREAQPLPRSLDPKFYARWAEEQPMPVPVEEICARWEGREGGTAPEPPAHGPGPAPAPAEDDDIPF